MLQVSTYIYMLYRQGILALAGRRIRECVIWYQYCIVVMQLRHSQHPKVRGIL